MVKRAVKNTKKDLYVQPKGQDSAEEDKEVKVEKEVRGPYKPKSPEVVAAMQARRREKDRLRKAKWRKVKPNMN